MYGVIWNLGREKAKILLTWGWALKTIEAIKKIKLSNFKLIKVGWQTNEKPLRAGWEGGELSCQELTGKIREPKGTFLVVLTIAGKEKPLGKLHSFTSTICPKGAKPLIHKSKNQEHSPFRALVENHCRWWKWTTPERGRYALCNC